MSKIKFPNLQKVKSDFKLIPGTNGFYLISKTSIIYSLKRNRILTKTLNNKGYFTIRLYIDNKWRNVKVSVLMAITYLDHKPDKTTKIVVDHIDNIKINDILSNLQLISNRENCSKDKFRKNYTSKYIGVSWCDNIKKWRSVMHINGKNENFGYYNSEIEARNIYNKNLFNLNNNLDLIYQIKERIKYTGVSFIFKIKKWKARVTINKKRIYLGLYKTKDLAENSIINYLNFKQL